MNVTYNEALISNYGELMHLRLRVEMLRDSLDMMHGMTLEQILPAHDLSIVLEDDTMLACKSVDDIERLMIIARDTCSELIEAAKKLGSDGVLKIKGSTETLLN